MGAATQSDPVETEPDIAGLDYKTSDLEPAGAEPIVSELGIHRALRSVDPVPGLETPDPDAVAGRLLMYRADLSELDASTDTTLSDPLDETSTPPAPARETPTRRSKLGLSTLITLPGARRRREAAVRAQLDEAEARLAKLEEEHSVQVDTMRQEADAARESLASLLETQAAENLEAAVQAEREDAEVRRARLEQDHRVQIDTLREEADQVRTAEVAAAETQAAKRIEALRREAEAALAILASQLEAQAETRVESAVSQERDDAERKAADTAQQHEAALAEVRAQLDDADALRVKLEQDHAVQIETRRREADTERAAEVRSLEAQAGDRLAAAQRAAAAALVARETELASQAATRVEAAVRETQDNAERKTAEAARQHESALAAVRAQLDDAEARRVKLEQAHAVQVATLRREADAARAAEVSATEARATERLEDLRREAEAALAILGKELESQAEAQVEAAVRVERDAAEARRAEIEQRHGVEVANVRAELDQAEARRVQLEQDHVAHVDTIRQEADAERSLQVAAAVREAQAESAQLVVETMRQHDAELASVRAEARADVAQANDEREASKREASDARRAAAETARRHEAELAAVRAQIEEAEERRVKLEHDHAVQVDTMRREANIAHLADVEALKASAAEQLAAAVRVTQTTAEGKLGETMKHHDAELASVRTQAQADASQAADELAELKQQVADTVNAATEAARRHDAQQAALRAELRDAEARRVKLEQDHVVRVDTVRREADRAHRTEIEVNAAAAAEQVAAAVRLAKTEAARELVETMKQRDVALARVRDEARADVARAEDELAQLKQTVAQASHAAAETERQHASELSAVQSQLEDAEAQRAKLEQDHAVRLDTVRREADAAHAAEVAALEQRASEQVAAAMRAAREDAASTSRQQAPKRDSEVDAARADVARARARVTEVEQALAAVRREADLARAEVARLRAEQADHSPERSAEPGDHQGPQRADTDVRSGGRRDGALDINPTFVKREVATRRRMAEITGGLILAGCAGTLIGWILALSRGLY